MRSTRICSLLAHGEILFRLAICRSIKLVSLSALAFWKVDHLINQHLQHTASGLSYSSDIVFDSFAVLWISLALVISMILLVTFFLIQYLYPGSYMRYQFCRRGSLNGTSSFKFIPYRDITQVALMHKQILLMLLAREMPISCVRIEAVDLLLPRLPQGNFP